VEIVEETIGEPVVPVTEIDDVDVPHR